MGGRDLTQQVHVWLKHTHTGRILIHTREPKEPINIQGTVSGTQYLVGMKSTCPPIPNADTKLRETSGVPSLLLLLSNIYL